MLLSRLVVMCGVGIICVWDRIGIVCGIVLGSCVCGGINSTVFVVFAGGCGIVVEVCWDRLGIVLL